MQVNLTATQLLICLCAVLGISKHTREYSVQVIGTCGLPPEKKFSLTDLTDQDA